MSSNTIGNDVDAMLTPFSGRADIFVYETARNCNPNGSFDDDNAPRTNDYSLGLMSDVSIKRRIRDAVAQIHEGEVKLLYDPSLVSIDAKAHAVIDLLDPKKLDHMTPFEKDRAVKAAFCREYWDVRTFGAAVAGLSRKGKDKAPISDGQITGCVQVTWAESLETIAVDAPMTITRVSPSTDKDIEKGKKTEVGKKWVTSGQYAYNVFVSSGQKARLNGFTEEDFNWLIEGIRMRWVLNQTSSKTGMEVDRVIVFRHNSDLGNCSISDLRKCIVKQSHEDSAGRTIYEFSVDDSKLPSGVTVTVY